MESSSTCDVVQIVACSGRKYLLEKRSDDDFWRPKCLQKECVREDFSQEGLRFMGGKVKENEDLEIVNGRVALALVEKEGEFLAVKRSEENSTPGKWATVSGGSEPGENPEEAAKRELREETGLKAEVMEKGEYYIGEGEQGMWRLEPVLMEYKGGEIDLNWELSEYRWVDPGEVENLETLGKLKGFDKLGLI
ncbi:MAG: NUDIX domain-containing protein [Candidatus Nanohalobium sp.]